jgi:hypothetical protein
MTHPSQTRAIGARETMDAKSTDYEISPRDAAELKGVALLPLEFRLALLRTYFEERGADAVISLFANFIGLANSVIENNKDALWVFGIIEAGMNDRQADDVNYASIFGALQGIELASKVDQRKTCHGCAFRLGSLANQSPSTTSDVYWCLGGDDRFMCHEHFDEEGNPTVPCGGHAQILARQKDTP